jgi:cobalt-zinc-cadmium efflux system outer membrane protein
VPLDRIREELAQDLPELRIEDLLGAADSTNAALLGLRQDAHAAALRVLQAEAERVPDLELRLGYTRAGEVDEDRVAVSVSLPLPVFDRNQARIAEARDLAGKARCEADALGQEIATEMAELHATYMAARDDVVACRERAVPAATAALAQTRVAVPAGKASVLELLDVQERFAAARLALASATHDLHAAAARLTLLTGRDFPADSTRRN